MPPLVQQTIFRQLKVQGSMAIRAHTMLSLQNLWSSSKRKFQFPISVLVDRRLGKLHRYGNYQANKRQMDGHCTKVFTIEVWCSSLCLQASKHDMDFLHISSKHTGQIVNLERMISYQNSSLLLVLKTYRNQR